MDYEGAKAKLLWNWARPEPEASEVYTDDAGGGVPPVR